ncbi:MAG: alpha/beta hydrolase [Elusimicrobia bacterium]|nr:alpha/beta hydrolase [Elusimicrobiota bacterium]
MDAVHEGTSKQGFESIRLVTGRGPVSCRLYPVPSARAALFVGGVGGGWDTPAHGLYPRLCADLPGDGIACLRLRFRDPTQLAEAEYDCLAAVEYLERRHATSVALVGHSVGAAAVLRAAARCAAVRTVVALAAQSHGVEGVDTLGPRCSTFFIHGLLDRLLPPACSTRLHAAAREPKRLKYVNGAGHLLDEAAEQVYRDLRAWLVQELQEQDPRSYGS